MIIIMLLEPVCMDPDPAAQRHQELITVCVY